MKVTSVISLNNIEMHQFSPHIYMLFVERIYFTEIKVYQTQMPKKCVQFVNSFKIRTFKIHDALKNNTERRIERVPLRRCIYVHKFQSGFQTPHIEKHYERLFQFNILSSSKSKYFYLKATTVKR